MVQCRGHSATWSEVTRTPKPTCSLAVIESTALNFPEPPSKELLGHLGEDEVWIGSWIFPPTPSIVRFFSPWAFCLNMENSHLKTGPRGSMRRHLRSEARTFLALGCITSGSLPYLSTQPWMPPSAPKMVFNMPAKTSRKGSSCQQEQVHCPVFSRVC